ncbi:MAG: DUF4265 domain-containing protein [Arachnia sp.]
MPSESEFVSVASGVEDPSGYLVELIDGEPRRVIAYRQGDRADVVVDYGHPRPRPAFWEPPMPRPPETTDIWIDDLPRILATGSGRRVAAADFSAAWEDALLGWVQPIRQLNHARPQVSQEDGPRIFPLTYALMPGRPYSLEHLWARRVDEPGMEDVVEILSVPFSRSGFHRYDLVQVRSRMGARLVVRQVRSAGHDTRVLTCSDETQHEALVSALGSVGLEYEDGADGIVAVDLPTAQAVATLDEILVELLRAGGISDGPGENHGGPRASEGTDSRRR